MNPFAAPGAGPQPPDLLLLQIHRLKRSAEENLDAKHETGAYRERARAELRVRLELVLAYVAAAERRLDAGELLHAEIEYWRGVAVYENAAYRFARLFAKAKIQQPQSGGKATSEKSKKRGALVRDIANQLRARRVDTSLKRIRYELAQLDPAKLAGVGWSAEKLPSESMLSRYIKAKP